MSAAVTVAAFASIGACAAGSATREVPRAAPAAAAVMTAADLLAIPHREPDHLIAYGADSSQYGELRLPTGAGPHAVVVLVHGGCWREFSSASSMGAMADALTADGIATWNIEYRRLHQSGGGWPGTYLDVGQAVDYLRTLAPAYHLDLGRAIVVGHSAGGHLAMWAAARRRLPVASPLYHAGALPIRGVVDLSGTPDMAADLPAFPTSCGEDVVTAMMGGTPDGVPDHYAQASAIRMLPLGITQVLVWGARDDQVPLAVGERYARMAREAGDSVRLIVDGNAGHFETASTRSATWPAVHSAINAVLKGTLPP